MDSVSEKDESSPKKKHPKLAGWLAEDHYADEAGVVVATVRRWFDGLGLRFRRLGSTRFYKPDEVEQAMATGEAPRPQPRRRTSK